MVGLFNVSKYYGSKCILNNINYVFDKGIYWIKGESGSGKTTLLNIISSRCSDHSGEKVVNNSLFYLSFNDYLVEELTVCENIKLYGELYKNFNIDKYEFKIKDFINKKVSKLSIGQKQTLGLILALSSNCKIILLDEPFSGLDKKNRDFFEKELYSKSEENLIIIASHYKVNGKIVEIKNGRIRNNKKHILKKMYNDNKKIKNNLKWAMSLHFKQIISRVLFVFSLLSLLLIYYSVEDNTRMINNEFENFSSDPLYYKKSNMSLTKDTFYDIVVKKMAYETEDYFLDIYFENIYDVEVKSEKKYIGNGSYFVNLKENSSLKNEEIILNINPNKFCSNNDYSICLPLNIKDELIGRNLVYKYEDKELIFKIVDVNFGEHEFVYVSDIEKIIDQLIKINSCTYYINYFLVIKNNKLEDFYFKSRNDSILNQYKYTFIEENDGYTYFLVENSKYSYFSEDEIIKKGVIACNEFGYSCSSLTYGLFSSIYYIDSNDVKDKIKYENYGELSYNEVVISSSLSEYLKKKKGDKITIDFYIDGQVYYLKDILIVDIINNNDFKLYHDKYDYEIFKDIFNKQLDVYYLSSDINLSYLKELSNDYYIINDTKNHLSNIVDLISTFVIILFVIVIVVLFAIETQKIKRHYQFFNCLKNNGTDCKKILIYYLFLYLILALVFIFNLLLFTIYTSCCLVFSMHCYKKIKSR